MAFPRTTAQVACAGVLLAFCLVACDATRFGVAAREDTEAAYLRYLADHPRGRHSPQASRRIDELRYQAARLADRPLGYRLYLQRHPAGRFAQAARGRLASLALAAARGLPGLRLVMERHAGTPEAEEAARRLPAALAREALAIRRPGPARAFLDDHPAAPEAPAVRAHLAHLLYAQLPDDQDELEAFVQEFGGTSEAVRALARLESVLAAELLETRSPVLLRQFTARFPRSARIVELSRAVQRTAIDRALVAVNVRALTSPPAAIGEAEARDLERAVRWCATRAARCEELRQLARRALPWQPPERLEVLRGRVYDADMRVTHDAIARVAYIRTPSAGTLLLELIGSARLATVWAAERALVDWIERLSSEARRSWAARQLRRAWRSANEDEVQRRGYLSLLAGREQDGEQLLRRGVEQGRTLTAIYLLLQHKRRHGQPLPPKLLGALGAAARLRVDHLRDAFPNEVHKDSLVAATLAERELHAVEQALAQLAPGPHAAPQLGDVRRAAQALLALWRPLLAKLVVGSEGSFAGGEASLLDAVSRHERGRAEALRTLRRALPLGPLVARAACALAPQRACTDERHGP